jgi:hypothetical protein
VHFVDICTIADDARGMLARAWLPTSTCIDDSTEIIEHAQLIPELGWGRAVTAMGSWFGGANVHLQNSEKDRAHQLTGGS